MYIRKMRVQALFIFIGLLLFSSVGCNKLEKLQFGSKNKALQPQGTVIAKVDNLPITAEQLDQEIQNYNQLIDNPAAKISTREQKLAYLNEELIRRYLFYLDAKARGVDERSKVQEILRSLEINVLANQLMQDEIGNLTVTSSEVEDFYNIYKDQYQQAEERRIREIALDSEQEAKDVLIELLKGADFATIASQRSRAESAGKGGDLGFIKRGQRGADFAAFDEVAFSRFLNTSQTSNIFKVKERYYIIKVETIKGGQMRPLSEVWDEINRNVLFLKQQQKLQEITAGLLKKNKVVIYDEKIK
ncbi:MAG: peptidyl-prolyl cis-trans isomerase [Candidatus Omnitrophota bacterium]|nr:peptidyl-prolyl cis-trans isomerase [Candidatus Omnitrophota bacterium]